MCSPAGASPDPFNRFPVGANSFRGIISIPANTPNAISDQLGAHSRARGRCVFSFTASTCPRS
jgi:hypothetical protein